MSLKILDTACNAPSVTPMENVRRWFIFRTSREAEKFLRYLPLQADQTLVGGQGVDTVGKYWWVGIQQQPPEARERPPQELAS